MIYSLVKQGNRWAIYDSVSRVFYFGRKRDLEKRVKELNSCN